MTRDLFTASRIATFRRCPRAHRYRYELGIQTPSGPSARFGTLAHHGLEAWYRQWQHSGAPSLEAAIDAGTNTCDSPIDAIRLRAILTAYHHRWHALDWEVLAVEQEFTYWLGDIEIGGKIDAIIRERSTGHAYVVEHKSTVQDTSAGSPYWAKLARDTQLSIYLDAAAFALDIPAHGAIYDVLKRPQHEPKLATPEESRRYTKGTGCSGCGGSGGGKRGIVQGRGYLEVVFASEVKRPVCEQCAGTGWRLGADGKPQAPHLDARQRDTDETLEEFEARLIRDIAERPDDYLQRGVIVRLDSELPRMRDELIEQVTAMRTLAASQLAPPNHSACAMGREMCGYWSACSGQADINDEHQFPRGAAHSELVQITNRAA